jgi:threonine aldolase
MQFASDNWAGAAPAIVDAIAAEAARSGPAYGGSDLDKAVEKRFAEIFERDVAVLFVATGSAANGLAMVAVNRPGGIVFCHRDAHMIEGECGGVEYLTGGARLFGLEGADGRLDIETLKAAVAGLTPGSEHHGQGMAVSITQQTEAGTAYSLDEIRQIASVAKANGLPLHMDGARFANALVHANANATPAEMSWKAGVDILSFGATKNGCVAAEALVFFDPATARDMPFLRKRAGQLFSKSRFVAAQFDAYLRDGLWLDLARHANSMADRLRAGLAGAAAAREAWPTCGNEIFAAVKRDTVEQLKAAGAVFHEWDRTIGVAVAEDETLIRLVTSFATTADEVDTFLATLSAK